MHSFRAKQTEERLFNMLFQQCPDFVFRSISDCANSFYLYPCHRYLPDPDVLAEEIAETLESALSSFREIIAQLKK